MKLPPRMLEFLSSFSCHPLFSFACFSGASSMLAEILPQLSAQNLQCKPPIGSTHSIQPNSNGPAVACSPLSWKTSPGPGPHATFRKPTADTLPRIHITAPIPAAISCLIFFPLLLQALDVLPHSHGLENIIPGCARPRSNCACGSLVLHVARSSRRGRCRAASCAEADWCAERRVCLDPFPSPFLLFPWI
jgi:hypothetical protein